MALEPVFAPQLQRASAMTAGALLPGRREEWRRCLLVIAEAGSGKTHTVAHRVAHLIVQGPDPRRTLLMTSCQSQSTTATASISISHSGAASAETPTSVLAGGVMPSKKAERAWPMMGRSSGL
jgi:UvrD/REP helicase N-terminal domain